MTDILVTPEELAAQSAEMANIKAEFDGLRSQLSTSLDRMNEAWSPNMSNNFSAKIQSAQRSFMSVLNMLGNGSAAARLAANTFDGNINGILTSIMDGDVTENVLRAESIADIFKRMESSMGLPPGVRIFGSDGSANAQDMIPGIGNWISENIASGRIKDLKDAESILDSISEGDYESGLKKALHSLVDITADVATKGGGKGSFLEKIDKATGGMFHITSWAENLTADFFKKSGHNTIDNLDTYIDQMKNGDYSGAAKTGLKLGWEVAAGPIVEVPGNAAVEILKKIFPSAAKYYSDRGANDFTGYMDVINGDINYMITGNKNSANFVGNYYRDHGGITQGVVDGLSTLGSYTKEAIVNWWTSLVN